MDFRQRLDQNRGKRDSAEPEQEPQEHTASEYFAVERIKSLPVCLDLRLADGRRKAVPYAYIVALYLDAENGIEIFTARERIHISGRNLLQLYDYLILYRVRFVQAHLGYEEEETGLFISDISVDEIQ